MAAVDNMARFQAALTRRDLTLDERDRKAALRVFLGLEQAAGLLRAQVATDESR